MTLAELRSLLHGADGDATITLARECPDFDRKYEITGVKHENTVDRETGKYTQKIVLLVNPKKKRKMRSFPENRQRRNL